MDARLRGHDNVPVQGGLRMSTTKSEFLNELRRPRGYVHQGDRRSSARQARPLRTVTGYIGFDCTAPSLHVGNLLGIMMLRKLQQAGAPANRADRRRHHQVGDPSGKDEARKLLTDAEIAANIGGIEFGIRKICQPRSK